MQLSSLYSILWMASVPRGSMLGPRPPWLISCVWKAVLIHLTTLWRFYGHQFSLRSHMHPKLSPIYLFNSIPIRPANLLSLSTDKAVDAALAFPVWIPGPTLTQHWVNITCLHGCVIAAVNAVVALVTDYAAAGDNTVMSVCARVIYYPIIGHTGKRFVTSLCHPDVRGASITGITCKGQGL